ncbi:hypothetical protein V6N13_004802 [Hibiscus sabdariffa]
MSRGCEARQCDVEGSMMGCHIADAGMIFVVNFIQYDGKYWKLRKVSDILYSAALPAESIVAEPQAILKEEREMFEMGKLLGARTSGNEENIVKDIAQILASCDH